MRHDTVKANIVSILAILSLTVSSCTPQPPDVSTSPFATPGGVLFLANCAACHGARAEGNVGPPLNAAGHAHHHSDTELVQAITQGIKRPGAPTEMPAWGQELSPQQVRQLVEFIKLTWTDEQRQSQGTFNRS